MLSSETMSSQLKRTATQMGDEGHDELQDRKIRRLQREVRVLKKIDELKYHVEVNSFGNTAYDINNSSVLVDPAQGTAVTERVGDRLQPVRISVRGAFRGSASGTGSDNGTVCRFVILQSKHGFVPSVTSTTSVSRTFLNPGTQTAVFSDFWPENRNKFTVLHDSLHTVDNGSTGGSNTAIVEIKRKLSRPITYQAAATTAQTGQIYLLTLSNFASAGNPPSVAWYSTVYFKDA